ncbi:unnamed protein product [Diatraea saccharalis]|uniref:Uncharacterized protein n=1 Tax=Diatraea saccharalis TaxID=40085 RepID=A0A9N9WF46_9NEOP|nr:unnamed protein product [Diatraea saccharalis]
MESIKQTFSEMLSTFNHRMESFESQLQQTSPTTDTDALTADFVAFKQFICTTLRSMQYQLEWVAREVDNIEMRGRRKILLLHGFGEMPGEETTSVVAKTCCGSMSQEINFHCGQHKPLSSDGSSRLWPTTTNSL